MKNYKNIFLIAIAAITFVSIQSCQKYEDGPMISFKTKTDRVANTWRVDNYKVNGSDYTSLVSDYEETYTKEGAYSYKWGIFTGTGTWAFQNNFSEIQLTGIDNQASHTMIIQKLEDKQFWYYFMDGSDKKEFHMVQK